MPKPAASSPLLSRIRHMKQSTEAGLLGLGREIGGTL